MSVDVDLLAVADSMDQLVQALTRLMPPHFLSNLPSLMVMARLSSLKSSSTMLQMPTVGPKGTAFCIWRRDHLFL